MREGERRERERRERQERRARRARARASERASERARERESARERETWWWGRAEAGVCGGGLGGGVTCFSSKTQAMNLAG